RCRVHGLRALAGGAGRPRRPRLRGTVTHRRAVRHGVPAVALVPAAIALAFLLLPLLGLALRAPWARFAAIFSTTAVRQSLLLSLWTSITATIIAVAFGVPLAWLLARGRFPGRRIVQGAVTLPLVLPPVVGGVALLGVLGRRGLLGSYLYDWFGTTITFTPAAVVLAQTFVAMPFLVVSVEGALRGADERFDEAAASLGAS